MKIRNITVTLAACTTLLLASCGGNAVEKQAGKLLEEAKAQYDKGEYDGAIMLVDSLRKTYPKAIEARKQGLRLLQEAELKRAQMRVERTDTTLQRVEREYQAMKKTVDSLRNISQATEEQLREVNLTRVRRDSLKTVFDVECAKIKYIKKKMEETE